MGKALKNGRMDPATWENTVMAKNMAREDSYGVTARATRVNSRKGIWRESVPIRGLMDPLTRVNGPRIRCMDKGCLLGQMAKNTQGPTATDSSMGTER
jgi:hypothetical protein